MMTSSRHHHETWLQSHMRKFGWPFVAELLDAFESDLRERIAAARLASAAARCGTVRGHLHSIRGGAQHLGLDNLSQACADGLTQVSVGHCDAALASLEKLADLFQRERAILVDGLTAGTDGAPAAAARPQSES